MEMIIVITLLIVISVVKDTPLITININHQQQYPQLQPVESAPDSDLDKEQARKAESATELIKSINEIIYGLGDDDVSETR